MNKNYASLLKLPSGLQEQECDAIMAGQEKLPSITYWGKPAFAKTTDNTEREREDTKQNEF